MLIFVMLNILFLSEFWPFIREKRIKTCMNIKFIGFRDLYYLFYDLLSVMVAPVCIFMHSMFQHSGIYILFKYFFFIASYFSYAFSSPVFLTQRGKSNVCPPFPRLELEYKMCYPCPWQGVLDTTLYNTV